MAKQTGLYPKEERRKEIEIRLMNIDEALAVKFKGIKNFGTFTSNYGKMGEDITGRIHDYPKAQELTVLAISQTRELRDMIEEVQGLLGERGFLSGELEEIVSGPSYGRLKKAVDSLTLTSSSSGRSVTLGSTDESAETPL